MSCNQGADIMGLVINISTWANNIKRTFVRENIYY